MKFKWYLRNFMIFVHSINSIIYQRNHSKKANEEREKDDIQRNKHDVIANQINRIVRHTHFLLIFLGFFLRRLHFSVTFYRRLFVIEMHCIASLNVHFVTHFNYIGHCNFTEEKVKRKWNISCGNCSYFSFVLCALKWVCVWYIISNAQEWCVRGHRAAWETIRQILNVKCEDESEREYATSKTIDEQTERRFYERF